MILACDVGGTKTNVALFEQDGARLSLDRLVSFPSREHASLSEIVAAFLGGSRPKLHAAGFGIAGPVIGNRAETTNLPWEVDGRQLARELGLKRVSMLNDLEVQAWALPELDASGQVQLQAGVPRPGNLAVIAAGTGLGMAALLRGNGPVRSLASEGGHAGFAPDDEIEIELLRVLQRQFGRVSAERVLSGAGLFRIYEFFRERDGEASPAWFTEALSHDDPAATVAHAALDGRSAIAERAVLLFVRAFGSEAGNWALRTMATGGVWLSGGIAHKLLVGPEGTSEEWRQRAREVLLAGFRNKGRLTPLVDEMPIHMITTDKAPLMGAARFALTEAGR
ncbi:MAG: glucokinase [Gemmatimonadaceae bacterium]